MKKISVFAISFAILVFFIIGLWAFYTIIYSVEKPMGAATEKFDVNYGFAMKPPFIYKYYLYKPYNYDKNKKYPLVLMLHGSSRHMRGGYYATLTKVQKQYPMFIVVPIAPPFTIWSQPNNILPKAYTFARNSISKVVNKYSIDDNRIFVTGYSMGGAGTFGMIHHYPNLFAAAIPLCGYWSNNLNDYKKIAKASLPIKIHHGTQDQSVAYKNSQDAFFSLRTLNADVELKTYRGMNHNIWDKIYNNINFWEWLNSQSKMNKKSS